VRKIVVHMQSTLDNRIANAQGAFWEPFPWGEPEVAYVNQFFRAADALALSRVMYDAIIPWWDGVATGQLPADAPEVTPAFAEFAQLQHRMTKVVFSNTMEPGDGRVVIRGDLAGQLASSSSRTARTSSSGAGRPPSGLLPARQDWSTST
jgi:hypothetical protein